MKKAIVDHYFPGLFPFLRQTQLYHYEKFNSEKGWRFVFGRLPNGQYTYLGEPAESPESITTVRLCVMKDEVEKMTSFGDVRYEYSVPTDFLRLPYVKKYTLYNIRFRMDYSASGFDIESSVPLRAGYYGITKRDPFKRLAEHWSKVKKGEGHLLHKTWRSIIDHGFDACPVFQISGMAGTLDEIYEMEEKVVDSMSLAPKGLNVVPGGYAGIRFLHNLRLLDRVDGVSIEMRDSILEELERSGGSSRCAFYRSGHIRKLSQERTTWVRPHWVNLKQAELETC